MNRFSYFYWTALLLAGSALLAGCGNGFGSATSTMPPANASAASPPSGAVFDPKKFWEERDKAGPGKP